MTATTSYLVSLPVVVTVTAGGVTFTPCLEEAAVAVAEEGATDAQVAAVERAIARAARHAEDAADERDRSRRE